MQPSSDISRLLDIMARLRTPGTGCPWDLKQNFSTIAPYTIEEAYEVADAIARHDLAGLKDELGDLLLQVVFHARMAEEEHAFKFSDVVMAITEKLIRRHPHVFRDARDLPSDEVRQLWEDIKAEERRDKAGAATSLLDGVPVALPALTRAEKIQRRAARGGFDWPDRNGPLDKIVEEVAELKRAETSDETEEEIGDLLFSVVNYARHAGVDSESALRRATAKFERRFRGVEKRASAGKRKMTDISLDELESFWQREKSGS
jgi:ATP diphosphatase